MSKAQVEKHSETWRAVEAHIEQRLSLHRDVVDTIGLPIEETEAARGAIQELKELRELAKPSLVTAVDDDLNQLGGMQ